MAKAKTKTTTKSADAALLKLGAILHQQIEEAYSHWRKSQALRAPLDRKLAKLTDYRDWDKRDAVWQAFDRTAAGKKADREGKAFNVASDHVYRTARAIMRKQPQTLAGAAVFSIAAFYEGEWVGFSFPAETGIKRILRMLSRGGGIGLPNGIRQVVHAD